MDSTKDRILWLPSGRDLRMIRSNDVLLPTLEAIYDAAADPMQWPRALDHIAGYFGDVGAVMLWRKDDETCGAIASVSLIEAQREYAQEGWAQRDNKAELSERSGYFFSGEPFADRHIAKLDEHFMDHPFSREFLTKHGLGWFGGVAVSPDPRIGVMLSVQRNFKTKAQFSDAELEDLGVLGRHVEKSLRLSIKLLDAQTANMGMNQALARIGIGVIALDSLGRVVFSNPVGQGFISDIFDMVGERLRLKGKESSKSFDLAIAQLLSNGVQTENSKPILVQSATLNRRIVIYLLPITPHLTEHFITQTRAIVLAIEQKPNEPADPAVVRDVLGLTLGEAKVAALVGSGLPTREVAWRLGIADETARSHLKSVYGKVGVSRRSELVAMLAKLMLH